MQLTAEQVAITEAFEADADIRVQAGAGCGKSSTLIEMAKTKLEDSGLFIAYNRAIKDDMAAKAPFNLEVSTSHSLAFRAVGVRYKHRLNGPRLPVRETARILGAKAFQIGEHPFLGEFAISRMVNDMLRRFTYSADNQIIPDHIEPVKGYSDAEMRELAAILLPLARRAWEDISDPNGKLRFEHDHYMKLWTLSKPKLYGEFLMLDESQDANPALTALIMDQDQMQRVSVGDSAQSIYQWRGAKDAHAALPGQEMTLSQSFRFGEAIAHEANDWLDVLDAPIRLRGFEQIDSQVVSYNPDAGTVLCRTNMGCMAEALDMMDSGHRVAIVGGAKQLQDLANACIELQDTGKTNHPELLAFDGWDDVREYSEDKEGADLKPLVTMVDRYTPKYLLARTRSFVDESYADRIVSTAHKAKGREWDHVRIGSDFHQEPEIDEGTGAKLPIEITRDEAMLCYVTVTRAKQTLAAEALDWFKYEPVVITK
jgi:superfamily I DNA/RNA helicase